jgi:hypothetical protein
MADAGKEGPHKPLMGAVTAMAQMCNQSELEPLRPVGDRENGRITSRTPARSRDLYNIQFVMDPNIRAWNDGNTDEGRKRS